MTVVASDGPAVAGPSPAGTRLPASDQGGHDRRRGEHREHGDLRPVRADAPALLLDRAAQVARLGEVGEAPADHRGRVARVGARQVPATDGGTTTVRDVVVKATRAS